jgi:Restriction endonuclease S subunits
MSNDAPQIRFKGFTDAWEQRKLGEEFYKVNERNDGSFGKQHWISVAKMYFQDPEKVQSNNIDTRTYVMRIGDIAFEGHPNAEFAFGRFVANDIGDGVVSELFPIYRHKVDYDNNYWKYAIQLETIMASIFAKSITSSGNSSNKLNEKHFLRQVIFVPNFDEQQKIGTFFNTLNNLITLHKRKLDSLKQLKRGYLQQMFPQVEETLPHVRFDGFSGDWEVKKLGEFSQIKTGASDVQDADPNGEYPFFIRSENIERSNKYLFDGEAILIPGEGRLGDIYHYINGKFDFHQRVYKISDFANNAYGLFILYTMQKTFKQHAMTFTVKATVDSLRLPVLTDFNILLPSIEEQTAIGNLFHNLDKQIAAQKKKLSQLKQLKSAYLQKMFV